MKRARGESGLLVPVSAEGPSASEPGDGQRTDAGLRPAGEHHLGVTVTDETGGVSDSVSSRGARGGHSMIGTLEFVFDAYVSCGHVDQDTRDEKRTDFAVAARLKGRGRPSDFLQRHHTHPDRHTGAQLLLGASGKPSTILKSQLSGADSHNRGWRHAVDLSFGQKRLFVEISMFISSWHACRHLTRDCLILLCVQSYQTAFSTNQTLPGQSTSCPERSNESDAGDHHPPVTLSCSTVSVSNTCSSSRWTESRHTVSVTSDSISGTSWPTCAGKTEATSDLHCKK